ncbi:unnamed protein product [Rhodiola kirilowii]
MHKLLQFRFLTTSISGPVERLVNSHGLPSESAAYISEKLKISGICSFNKLNPDRLKLEKCDSLFGVLKIYGFSGSQIAQLIQKRPSLLGTKIESLEHKLKLLSERFRSTRKTLSNLIVSNPAVFGFAKQRAPSSKVTIKHLIDSYELPPETATLVFDKLSLDREKTKNFDAVLNLLKSYGFSGVQIAGLIKQRPSFTGIKCKTLVPKLKFLREKGFSGKSLADLISINPAILNRGLESQLEVAWDILKKKFGTDEQVVAIVKRAPRFLTSYLGKNLQPNIIMLQEEGVHQASILKLVMLQPWVILEKPERMAYAIKAVKELGRHPSSLMFIHVLRSIIPVNEETWISKMEMFKKLGWTEQEIRHMLQHYPLCFSTSDEKIRASWDFFMNEVKYDRSMIIGYPKFLMYGLETRVRPRFKVFKVLKSMSLIREKTKFSSVVNRSELQFIERYILPFDGKIPHLMELYRGTASAKKE